MRFGIFYEHQFPRPWDDGGELKLFQDALDQVELGLTGQVHRLGSRDDSELLAVDADQAHRTDADLLIDA